MNSINFSRIGDNDYSFNINKEGKKQLVVLHSDVADKSVQTYRIAQILSREIPKLNLNQSLDKLNFKIDGRVYRLVHSRHFGKRIFSAVSTFFKNFRNESMQEYRLQEVGFQGLVQPISRVSFRSFFLSPLSTLRKTIRAIQITYTTALHLLTSPFRTTINLGQSNLYKIPAERRELLNRRVESLENIKNFSHAISASAFSDPYTKVATEGFQKYEKDFISHDTPDNPSKYCLVVLKGSQGLTLAKIKDLDRLPIEDHQSTLTNYFNFIVRNYGREKIDYIQKLYGIDLPKMISRQEPLTPEIVYRINIGVGNIESKDIDKLCQKMSQLKRDLSLINPTEHNLEGFLKNSFENWDVTLREVAGIYRILKKSNDNPTLQDLQVWLNSIDPGPVIKGKSVSETLPLGKFNQLMEIYAKTPEEQNNQYTGRKIGLPIESAYTQADTKEYKPWIDQQELLQTFDEIKAHPSWDNYFEELTFIICKKHLVRVHPEEGYSVGAILPAPPNDKGEPQWYKVTSFVNNGKGIVSYTLEPACQEESTLPAIKLYRSTASDKYALDSEASVKNDFNPFNSPGYEGGSLAGLYEDNFFNERTIPVWVGYQLEAQKRLQNLPSQQASILTVDLKQIYNTLIQANEEVYLDVIRPAVQHDLHTFIRAHDAEFNQFLAEASRSRAINPIDHIKLCKILYENSRKAAAPTQDSLAKQREEAFFVMKMIEKSLPKLKSRMNANLYYQLKIHIVNPLDLEIKNQKELMGFYQQTGKELSNFRTQLASLFAENPPNKESIKNKLNEWNKRLHTYALSKGEDITQKKQQPIVLAGHSLGGACAQKYLVHYTSSKHRIPLPDQHISIRVFDDPAINKEDNESFLAYGNRHQNLLINQNIKFNIIRRQEEGDIVPMAGEEHLGATHSLEEQAQAYKWMKFDGVLQSGLNSAKAPAIRDAKFAHAGRFGIGAARELTASQVIKRIHLPKEELKRVKRMSEAINKNFDFKRIAFSSVAQGQFDQGTGRKWKELNQIWNLSFMNPVTAEKLRGIAGLIARTNFIVSKLTKHAHLDSKAHGEWWRYRDYNGVFAVTERDGIISA